MRARRAPRALGSALDEARAGVQPRTFLAAVQSAWPRAVGARVAAEAQPVAEREGVVTIACRSATWAQELDLLQEELLGRLNGALDDPSGGVLERLRFTADGARHEPPR
ncbi:MAG TPA: DciA family protein [Solirubrobacterales bacterium]|nr:DciA family protein [Solirubrobacterales bacterium]